MSAPPFARLDHLVIAVRDLDAASAAHATMLGRDPSWRGVHPAYGTANVLFGLSNCYVELLALGPEPSGHPVAQALAASLEARAEDLFALALGSDDLERSGAALAERGLHPGPLLDGEGQDAEGTTRRWRSFMLPAAETRGLNVFAIEHADRAAIPAATATADPATVATGVDHVVMFSDDLDATLGLWRDALGVAERWRREFPERGTVNVGLRLGGVTFELVAPLQPGSGERRDRLWGVAYAVPDCDATVVRLRGAGVAVGDARPGLAPATRVATVKREAALPTLLIEHTGRVRRSQV